MQDKRTKTDEYRASQKSYTSAQMSRDGAILLAQSFISDGLVLHAELPSTQLAELLVRDSDPELIADLSAVLVQNFYLRRILTERRKEAAAKHVQLRLPGFELLPAKIPVGNGKRIRLLSANHTGVRAYYRFLKAKLRDRQKNDPQLQQAKELLDRMAKRSRTEKRITVREVILIDG